MLSYFYAFLQLRWDLKIDVMSKLDRAYLIIQLSSMKIDSYDLFIHLSFIRMYTGWVVVTGTMQNSHLVPINVTQNRKMHVGYKSTWTWITNYKNHP